jgi:hypothetical protein
MKELDRPVNPHKASVIDHAFARYDLTSFVDLGGCWGVNGAYTFHALRRGGVQRAVLVDGTITDLTRERAVDFRQLELLEAALGDEQTAKQVGDVDAAIMYDILLHQVSPDWTDFLGRYADTTDTLIIHNQCWLGPETVRFPDFHVEEYLRRVYHTDPDRVREWYGQHGEFNVEQQKSWRDVHNFWQWGITAKDLVGVLWDLGYRVDYFHNAGLFDPRFPEIEVLSVVGRKRSLPHAPAPVASPSRLSAASRAKHAARRVVGRYATPKMRN